MRRFHVRLQRAGVGPVPAHDLQGGARARAGLACLGGAAAASVPRRWRAAAGSRASLCSRRVRRAARDGRAVDESQPTARSPPNGARRSPTPANGQTTSGARWLLPGELFGYYQLGRDDGPDRAGARREAVAHPRGRALRGPPLEPVPGGGGRPRAAGPARAGPARAALLELTGVGQVLVPADGRRSEAAGSTRAGRAGARGGAMAAPGADLRPRQRVVPARGWGGVPRELPARAPLPIAAALPTRPRATGRPGMTVLDGDAHGVAALAAHGALAGGRAPLRGRSRARPSCATELERGGTLVLTDSNRAQRSSTPRACACATAPRSGRRTRARPDSPTFELFDRESNDQRTLALYSGLRTLESPIQAGQAIFPEHRPFAAVDGRPRHVLARGQEPRRRPALDRAALSPAAARTDARGCSRTSDARGAHGIRGGVRERRRGATDGGERGGNELELERAPAAAAADPHRARCGSTSAGAAAAGSTSSSCPASTFVRRCGCRSTRRTTRAAPTSPAAPIEVLLERTTADFPYRAGDDVAVPQARSPLDAVDPEQGIERRVTLPEARTFELSGWASVDPAAPDDALDASRATALPRRRGCAAPAASRACR